MTVILEDTDPYTKPSFSLQNRLQRVSWGLCYVLLFRPSPRPLHAWRAFLLRRFGARLGQHCHVYPKVRIWAPWNLIMHDYAGMADEVNCYNIAPIVLGERVVVSQGVHLCTGTHDYEHPQFQLYALPIHIGERAWLCADAFIGPGVTVGAGSVIGARSVVTKNMPVWSVCAGNPCKSIKPRLIRQEMHTGEGALAHAASNL
jgi:putative colanic acid biosynthesis acetyltransferase WcaF